MFLLVSYQDQFQIASESNLNRNRIWIGKEVWNLHYTMFSSKQISFETVAKNRIRIRWYELTGYMFIVHGKQWRSNSSDGSFFTSIYTSNYLFWNCISLSTHFTGKSWLKKWFEGNRDSKRTVVLKESWFSMNHSSFVHKIVVRIPSFEIGETLSVYINRIWIKPE